jgi:hypothetical protein
MSQTFQLVILIGGALLTFAILLLGVILNRWRRTYGTNSARFLTATALGNLSKKIAHLAGPGVEVLMPAGHGLYPLTLSRRERQTMEARLEEWTRSGLRYSVIITSPNDEAEPYWQALVDRLPDTFNVFMLDRQKASSNDALDIQRLDRVHTVLIVRGNEPCGMWLEGAHDKRSRIAYNVEYVAATDIVDFQFERFSRFLGVLRRLTDESKRPPHLRRLRRRGEIAGDKSVASAA